MKSCHACNIVTAIFIRTNLGGDMKILITLIGLLLFMSCGIPHDKDVANYTNWDKEKYTEWFDGQTGFASVDQNVDQNEKKVKS